MSVTINGTTGISAIPDDIVTTDKILDGAVTAPKLDSGVLQDYQRISLETSQVAAGTYIEFINIPAWAKKLTILFQGISLSGTDRPLIQFGDSGGLVITGYDSLSTYMNTASTYNFTATNATGFVINCNVEGNTLTGAVCAVKLSGNTWLANGVLKTGGSLTTSVVCSGDAAGLSSALETVRITTTGTNTFDAGTFGLLVEG